MRIGLLVCDHVRERLQPQFGDYSDFFIRLFDRVAPEDEVRVYDVIEDKYPSRIDECDVYFISGSKKSCYEPFDWIEKLHDYVRECHAVQQPLVGICFGHQVMARALDGVVERSCKGWGVSVHTYLLEDELDVFEGKNPVRLVVSHQDQVIEPGKGGKVIGGSDFCPNAFITYGNSISTQGHPEFNVAYSKIIVDIRCDNIGEQAYKQAQHDAHKEHDGDLIAKSMLHYHQR